MLSTRLLRPPGRQLLSRISIAPPPPLVPRVPLRTARAFHATPRKNAALDALLYVPHEMMSMIHTHLPWYATLPLTAFCMRALLVTTAGTYVRALTARYIGTHPVRQAIAYQKRNALMLRGGYSNPKQAKTLIAAAVKKETKELDQRWNCTIWGQVNWTLAQMPIFFTMAELIRQMCGTRDGLLGNFLTHLGLKSKTESIHDVVISDPSPFLEPTLANEGMLWFPDLLSPDPFLPYIVSALMFTNVYLSKNGITAHPSRATRFSRNIRYALMGVSLLIGPLCQDLPAALMLYWASSTTSVIIWNKWLDWKHPAPSDFLACRRPLQILPSGSTVIQKIKPGLEIPMMNAKAATPHMQVKRRQQS